MTSDTETRVQMLIDELIRGLAPALANLVDRHAISRAEVAATLRSVPIGTSRMAELVGVILELLAQQVIATAPQPPPH